jgi:hypothetical protein
LFYDRKAQAGAFGRSAAITARKASFDYLALMRGNARPSSSTLTNGRSLRTPQRTVTHPPEGT